MDFDNRKVYGDTFISDGLVLMSSIITIFMIMVIMIQSSGWLSKAVSMIIVTIATKFLVTIVETDASG